MAAAKSGAVKGRQMKKGIRGRIPVKRTINLVPVNEDKISLKLAIPGILLILVLAGLFSKFLVIDRLTAMSKAAARTARLQSELDDALAQVTSFGDVENTYAHYTLDGMTKEELSLVDRPSVVELVSSIIPAGKTEKTWSLSGNILTIEITAKTLEDLNQLAREIEEDPIVDSCSITTANKNQDTVINKSNNRKTVVDTDVWARFIVYLRQPEEDKT